MPEEVIVYEPGDLNQDGVLNILDIIIMVGIITGGGVAGGNTNDLIDSLDDMLDE